MVKSFLVFTLVISLNLLKSQITFHDIAPDTTINSWNAFVVSPSNIVGNYFEIWWYPTPEVLVKTNGNCQILILPSNSLPSKLNFGDSISPTGNWISTTTGTLNNSGTGNWLALTNNKYLGFRFKKTTGNWYYGWLKLSVDSNANSFTVKEWGYNSSTDQPILAGQTNISTFLSNISPDNYQFSLYYNSGQIALRCTPDLTEASITIYSLEGRLLTNSKLNSGTINIGYLSNGIYVAILSKGNEVLTRKFVIRSN